MANLSMIARNFVGRGKVTSSSASSALIWDGTSCQYRIRYVAMACLHQTQEQIDCSRGISAIAIGTDLISERLADRRSADCHFDMPEAGRIETIDDFFHVHHGGC